MFVVTNKISFLGKTLNELKLKNHILVAAISRGNEMIVPKGGTTIELGDHVIIISRDEKLKTLNDIIRR